MINPVSNMMGRISGAQMMGGINQLSGMAQAFSNPQAMIQQILQSNPNTQKVMDIINQNGGGSKAVFYKMAQQKGVDPDAFADQVKQMLG